MTAFTEANMGAYFFNSILVTIIAMVLSLCLSVPASYVLARQKFFGCSFIKNLFMAGLFIQPVYIIVPLFTILEKMKLLICTSSCICSAKLTVLNLYNEWIYEGDCKGL